MDTDVPLSDADLGGRMAPKFAEALVAIVFAAFSVLAILNISRHESLSLELKLLGVGLQLALLAIQMTFVRSHAKNALSRRTLIIIFIAQTCLIYLPFYIYDWIWLGMPGFLAGSALLVFRPAVAWTTFGVVTAVQAYVQSFYIAPGENPFVTIFYGVVWTMTVGFIVYGLTRLARLVTAMDDARSEMAKLAVAAERLRFSRDLHDLLGYSLSAISLKSELTHRLVTKNPARAEEELTQILEISRQALADVRSVASGYRELSLDEEALSARSVLVAADVEVRMELEHHDLSARVRTVLATILREGVTNILRHSKAEHCEIMLRQSTAEVVIEISNDGVQAHPVDLNDHGSGIHNLSNRVADLGGRLVAQPMNDNRFRLNAVIPTGRQEIELTRQRAAEGVAHSS